MTLKNCNLNDVAANIHKQLKESVSVPHNVAPKRKQKEQYLGFQKVNPPPIFPTISKRIGKLKKTQSFSCYVASDCPTNNHCQKTTIAEPKKKPLPARPTQAKIKRIGKVNPSKAFNQIVLNESKNTQKDQANLKMNQNLQSGRQNIAQSGRQNKVKIDSISNKLYRKQKNRLQKCEQEKQINTKKHLKYNKNLSNNSQNLNKSIQNRSKTAHRNKNQQQDLHTQQMQQINSLSPIEAKNIELFDHQNSKHQIQKQGNKQCFQNEEQNSSQLLYKIIINIVSHKSIDHKQEHQYPNQCPIPSQQHEANPVTTPIKSLMTNIPQINYKKKPIIHERKIKKSESNIQKHMSQHLSIYKSKNLNSSRRAKSKQKISVMCSSLATPEFKNLGTDKVDSSRTFNSCESKQILKKSISKLIIQEKPHILFKSHPFLDNRKKTKQIRQKRSNKGQKNNHLERYSVTQFHQKDDDELKTHLIQIKNKKLLHKKNSKQLKMHYCLQAARQHLQNN